MKEITIKFDEKFYKRLNEARKLEAPDIRNAKFCKELVEAMVGAIEDDHKNKGDKSANRKERTNKQTKQTKPRKRRRSNSSL
jgi:hypothetical protein